MIHTPQWSRSYPSFRGVAVDDLLLLVIVTLTRCHWQKPQRPLACVVPPHTGCCVCCLRKGVIDHQQAACCMHHAHSQPTHPLHAPLPCVRRSFRLGRQEDAHEYLRCVLDSMHEALLRSLQPKPPPDATAATFVQRIFGGRLRSQVRCGVIACCSMGATYGGALHHA